jgi:hypothetical protein
LGDFHHKPSLDLIPLDEVTPAFVDVNHVFGGDMFPGVPPVTLFGVAFGPTELVRGVSVLWKFPRINDLKVKCVVLGPVATSQGLFDLPNDVPPAPKRPSFQVQKWHYFSRYAQREQTLS